MTGAGHDRLAEHIWRKLDPQLQRVVEASPPDVQVPVLIRFRPSPAPTDLPPEASAAAQEASFLGEAREVVALLHAAGAEHIQVLWITQAVSASIPLHALTAIGDREEVIQIQLVIQRPAISSWTARPRRPES